MRGEPSASRSSAAAFAVSGSAAIASNSAKSIETGNAPTFTLRPW